MTTIRQQDFIQSVADALQFISYYHPVDYIEALGAAYHAEESAPAKDARAVPPSIPGLKASNSAVAWRRAGGNTNGLLLISTPTKGLPKAATWLTSSI